ncbi:MAG TPA: hypothetical protein DCL49_06255 [Candidatus Omnitrophica bacterium]|nr:MAG: hypothetical protein A2062_06430 [Omnitrophica WOR_2 bacterium GWA2_44_7]HAH20492.1 hypothetical protein [Candidatus Omnitrophota bacterium]HBG62963.1 hypothetical protein [Candidatus Omnitrophota bacterium]HCD38241.1 hypothetical protein [Candidatus Omnitrophota bacterium]
MEGADTMNENEKRKHKRALVKLKVEYRGKSFWQMVEAQDLSAGGMFIATEKVEPAQTKIEVMFELGKENKKTIRAEGVVAWNRTQSIKTADGEVLPAGMGIMFTKITPFLSKQFIDDMIKNSGG